nr:helix-turn-helix domain-containing protein [Burkholderia sp. TSV86]
MSRLNDMCRHQQRRPCRPVGSVPAVRQIGIVLFDQFSLTEVSGITEWLDCVNRRRTAFVGSVERYALTMLSSAGGCVTSMSGVQIWTESIGLHSGGEFHMVLVAGGAGAPAATLDDALHLWLHDAARSGEVQVYSMRRDGGDIIAAAGSDACMLPPRVQPAPANLPLRRLSSASLASGAFGFSSEALQPLARGSASDAPAEPRADAHDRAIKRAGELIREVAQRLAEQCDQTISIADVAQDIAMSERNFLRRFKLEMGVTPSEYLLQARIERACSLLTESDLPVDKIARRAGLGNGERLAKVFRRRLSMSPTEYRAAARWLAAG